jgi:pimeloyl-ACP methyl ester carboxylesterase
MRVWGIVGSLLGILPLCAAASTPHAGARAPPSCTASRLNIEGNQIWIDEEGSGRLTVVFESGFGNDSSVWSAITPKIRSAGVKTFIYDRAGMGQSTLNEATPFSIDHDVGILQTALTRCGVHEPIVIVGHSYGGAMSLLLAGQDRRIRGVVLLDAVVPKVWPKSEVDRNLAMMRAQYAELREKAPALAKVAIPWAEALPQTARRVDAIRIPNGIPVIDIVAENGQSDPTSAQVWRAAHADFVAAQPSRRAVLAQGSSHKVMSDKPDLVVQEILAMIDLIQR